MAGKTAYLERKLIDHSTGKTSYTMPTVYVGLFTAAPSDAGGGTEVTGGSYARKSTAAADWSAAATVRVCRLRRTRTRSRSSPRPLHGVP
jgi:hypothetical protein